MIALIVSIKAWLDSVDPKLFYLAVSGLVGGLVYLWRRFSISSWDWVTRKSPAVQTLPALVLAGLISAAPTAGLPMIKVIEQIILGAFAGALPAIAGHTVLKAIPWLPYNGGVKPTPAKVDIPPAGPRPGA